MRRKEGKRRSTVVSAPKKTWPPFSTQMMTQRVFIEELLSQWANSAGKYSSGTAPVLLAVLIPVLDCINLCECFLSSLSDLSTHQQNLEPKKLLFASVSLESSTPRWYWDLPVLGFILLQCLFGVGWPKELFVKTFFFFLPVKEHIWPCLLLPILA